MFLLNHPLQPTTSLFAPGPFWISDCIFRNVRTTNPLGPTKSLVGPGPCWMSLSTLLKVRAVHPFLPTKSLLGPKQPSCVPIPFAHLPSSRTVSRVAVQPAAAYG